MYVLSINNMIISISEELPNLTGQDVMEWYGVHSGLVNNHGRKTGVFNASRVTQGGNLGGAQSGNINTPRGIAFSASASNSIYSGSHVHPLSRKTVFLIRY